ncbi:glycerophosphodiester phosphodiesterase family protein [Pedomonas mirosovicensis]|uniref:glycerophosphodiester phosphodiesterase family protein n=1 Tax=Pedomonas mirosovicensis TaxID=2908641 RepID=UPI002168F757|nr:glycerophosphodiester phosphodiesterase family protein [Pedomonas mirosovicensis]MCH8685944.1 glycerophosphodiester phosphodiesterase [Pedomonas mirosovicensis]
MTKQRLLQDYASWLKAKPFVRGGLAGGVAGAVPHSLAAIERAIKAGLGVVLEAQLTFDGDAVVFGEARLDRLTDLSGEVGQYSSAQLQAQKLKGTNEPLRSLSCLLPEIAGRTPVLIDACNAPKDPLPLCFAIRRALEGYGGPIGILARHPRIIGWFGEHSRRVARGLVISDRPEWSSWRTRSSLWRNHAIRRTHPDFAVFDVASLPSVLATRLRQQGKPVLAWPVRTEEDRVAAIDHADNIIQEPDLAVATAQPKARPQASRPAAAARS